jgi:hypothetical protein
LHCVGIIFLVTITRSLYQLSCGIKMLVILVSFLLINEIYFNGNWISFVMNFICFHVTFMLHLLQWCYHQFHINFISYISHKLFELCECNSSLMIVLFNTPHMSKTISYPNSMNYSLVPIWNLHFRNMLPSWHVP